MNIAEEEAAINDSANLLVEQAFSLGDFSAKFVIDLRTRFFLAQTNLLLESTIPRNYQSFPLSRKIDISSSTLGLALSNLKSSQLVDPYESFEMWATRLERHKDPEIKAAAENLVRVLKKKKLLKCLDESLPNIGDTP